LYQFARAISESNQAVKLDQSPSSYSARANMLTKSGDFKSALRDYDQAASLPEFKPSAQFYMDRASVKASLSNFEGALQDVSQASSLDPKNKLAYMIKRSDIFAQSKAYKPAREELDKVLVEDPNNAEALFKHGWYSELGNNKITAMDDYFKAIKVAPRNPQGYLRRGVSYFQSRQFDSAAADFRQALALDPGLTEAREKLQKCIVESKQLAATTPEMLVREELTKLELNEIANMSPQELLQKGYQSLQQHKIEYALAALTRAVRKNPNDKEARNYLFHALVASGQTDLAITQILALERIGDLKVEDEIGFVNALRDAGSDEQARKLVDHLIERFATDSAALAVIAQNCSTWDYEDKVKEACDKAIEITKDINRATSLEDLRDVAVKKLAQKKLQPAQLSIYKAGEGEPSAPR
jgi:tetratricopeptide (TPR) repeat protein